MPKNIGEISLAELITLIKEKSNYLKGLIDGKSEKSHTHADYVTTKQVEELIESIVLQGYLDGKRIRYVDDVNDNGKTGYLTIKKG